MIKSTGLKSAIDAIEKQYGKGAIMKLSDESILKDIEVIPSGSLNIDMALGVGGWPCGRIIEIIGHESSGKTTLAIHAISEAQKLGKVCAFVDAEHAFDKKYAENLGVNTDELYFVQPDHGEQALDITETLIRSNEIGLIIVDSVAALVPKGELEGEMGESKMGLQARLMSQAMRKLTGAVSKSKCTVIFLNQYRKAIGVVYGNPNVGTGGEALKYYSSVRVETSRSGQIKDSDEVTGNKTRVKVLKNKVAPPHRVVEVEIVFGEGISKIGEIIDLGVELDVIKKSGSWYSYGDTKIGQGAKSVKELLLDNPELYEEIEEKILEKIK